MEFQQRDSVLIDRARNWKKVFIVAFALIFAGCSKTEGLENIEKSFIEPTYAAVVTRERIAEKPSYEWITESAIKREDKLISTTARPPMLKATEPHTISALRSTLTKKATQRTNGQRLTTPKKTTTKLLWGSLKI